MTTIRLAKINELSAADWTAWTDIQQSSGAYESPYFRPEFAQAVAAVRSDAEVAVFSQGDETVGFFPFQRGKLNLGKPIGGKLSDYHGPLVRSGVEFDAWELMRACRLAAWDFDHLVTAAPALDSFIKVRGQSPQIDIADGFEAYEQRRREAGSELLQSHSRKTRKLVREVGALSLTFDASGDTEAYELLKSWKSAQYVRTGLTNVFAFPWVLALLERLREHRGEDFAAPLSVLRAGNTIAAVFLALRSRGVLHGWFSAYNQELSAYSPGITLLIQLAREGAAHGVCKIDLGRGDEAYKWSLASGGIEVGEGSISCPSLATWLRNGWRGARDWMERSSLKKTAALPVKWIRPVREWLAYD